MSAVQVAFSNLETLISRCILPSVLFYPELSPNDFVHSLFSSIAWVTDFTFFPDIQVIDDEKKTQELEAKKGGQNDASKGPTWDAPYPEGVKKHKIHSPENPERKAKLEEEDEDEDEKNIGELGKQTPHLLNPLCFPIFRSIVLLFYTSFFVPLP